MTDHPTPITELASLVPHGWRCPICNGDAASRAHIVTPGERNLKVKPALTCDRCSVVFVDPERFNRARLFPTGRPGDGVLRMA